MTSTPQQQPDVVNSFLILLHGREKFVGLFINQKKKLCQYKT